MEQFDSSVQESSKVSEQQLRNDEQQRPSCAAELTETSVWIIAADKTVCMRWSNQRGSLAETAWYMPRRVEAYIRQFQRIHLRWHIVQTIRQSVAYCASRTYRAVLHIHTPTLLVAPCCCCWSKFSVRLCVAFCLHVRFTTPADTCCWFCCCWWWWSSASAVTPSGYTHQTPTVGWIHLHLHEVS